ncbi:hypothetical protein [Chryseobacterium binzhouense]|uniref:hypothetical protein n=1 Tax=Chryseobacterium binzhouense TaxID=2593646 RepID=UPI0011815BC9|nr:hypothetical protein [Chryseobacterium binzhouense]
MLISYNLTPQEKQMMMSGEYVDTQDKTTVTLLDGTVYNPLGAKSNQSCVWQSYIVGYTACSENAHFNGEGSNACSAKVKSKPIKEYYLQCKSIAEAPTDNGWWAGPGGGTNSGGGDCSSCPAENPTPEPEPCNGNGVSIQPVDPIGGIAEGGCEGIPTVIEFPLPDEACENAKADLSDPFFKQQFINLNTPANYNSINEKGAFERTPPVGSGSASSFVPMSNQACTTHLTLPANKNGITGLFHIHNNINCNDNPTFGTKVNVKAPSPKDLYEFFHIIIKQANLYKGSYSKGYFVTMTDWGSYMFKYNGTNWPSNVTGADFARWKNWYEREFQNLEYNQQMDSENVKRVFAQFLKEVVQVDGLDVFEITENSASKLDYDLATKKAISIPCPKK